jgi:hypothetical protein
VGVWLAAFVLVCGFGFPGELGVERGVVGVVDVLVGPVFLIGLPKALNTTAAAVLLDRRVQAVPAVNELQEEVS